MKKIVAALALAAALVAGYGAVSYAQNPQCDEAKRAKEQACRQGDNDQCRRATHDTWHHCK